MKKMFCFIPAKQNSTRLKNKNQVLLDGFPLFYYPISAALNSGVFNKEEVVVSSDADQILEQASIFGAFTPYRREEKLSKDPAGVYDVLLDFLYRFPAYKEYQYVCILLPTSPLTSSQDVKQAFKIVEKNQFDCLLSVSETPHNAQLALTINNKLLSPLHPDKIFHKSQELEPTYHANGAIHIVNINKMIENQSYLIEPMGSYVMPFERSIDVDTKQDLDLVKFILSR